MNFFLQDSNKSKKADNSCSEELKIMRCNRCFLCIGIQTVVTLQNKKCRTLLYGILPNTLTLLNQVLMYALQDTFALI